MNFFLISNFIELFIRIEFVYLKIKMHTITFCFFTQSLQQGWFGLSKSRTSVRSVRDYYVRGIAIRKVSRVWEVRAHVRSGLSNWQHSMFHVVHESFPINRNRTQMSAETSCRNKEIGKKREREKEEGIASGDDIYANRRNLSHDATCSLSSS